MTNKYELSESDFMVIDKALRCATIGRGRSTFLPIDRQRLIELRERFDEARTGWLETAVVALVPNSTY